MLKTKSRIRKTLKQTSQLLVSHIVAEATDAQLARFVRVLADFHQAMLQDDRDVLQDLQAVHARLLSTHADTHGAQPLPAIEY